MRHLPSVGALPVPPEAVPYIVVKQDNNGTTFVVRDQPIGWLLEYCDHHAESGSRNIGPWEHTTRSDVPADILTGQLPDPLAPPRRPPVLTTRARASRTCPPRNHPAQHRR